MWRTPQTRNSPATRQLRRFQVTALEPQVAHAQPGQLLPLAIPADPDHRPVAAGELGEEAHPRLQTIDWRRRPGRLEPQLQRHAGDRRPARKRLEQRTQRPGSGHRRLPVQPHRQLSAQVASNRLAMNLQLLLGQTTQLTGHRRSVERHHLGQARQPHVHGPGHARPLDDDVRGADRFVVGPGRRGQDHRQRPQQDQRRQREPATPPGGHDGWATAPVSVRASAAPANPAARHTSSVATR